MSRRHEDLSCLILHNIFGLRSSWKNLVGLLNETIRIPRIIFNRRPKPNGHSHTCGQHRQFEKQRSTHDIDSCQVRCQESA